LRGSVATISQLPSPTCALSESYDIFAPTPEAGPENVSSIPGSRSASGFQSGNRRRLLSVSYTIVILRLVSTFSSRWRLEGSTSATSRNRARQIAREIRISIRRFIQGSPGGPGSRGRGTDP